MRCLLFTAECFVISFPIIYSSLDTHRFSLSLALLTTVCYTRTQSDCCIHLNMLSWHNHLRSRVFFPAYNGVTLAPHHSNPFSEIPFPYPSRRSSLFRSYSSKMQTNDQPTRLDLNRPLTRVLTNHNEKHPIRLNATKVVHQTSVWRE